MNEDLLISFKTEILKKKCEVLNNRKTVNFYLFSFKLYHRVKLVVFNFFATF